MTGQMSSFGRVTAIGPGASSRADHVTQSACGALHPESGSETNQGVKTHGFGVPHWWPETVLSDNSRMTPHAGFDGSDTSPTRMPR